MNAKIIIAIVISLIIGGSIGYGISSSTISEMRSKIQTLQMSYQDLNSTYQSYVSTHSYSNSEYEALNRSYQQLKEDYVSLNSDYQQLQTWLDGNLSLVNSLNLQIAKLQSWLDDNLSLINSLNLQIANLQAWLDGNLSLIDSLNSTYNDLREAYEKLQEDYSILNNTRLVFNGLKISVLKCKNGSYWDVLGNVTNVSNESMSKVYVILFVFNPNGSLYNYYVHTIENLAVNETDNFEFTDVLEEDQTFRVVAVGSYGFSNIESNRVAELLAEIEQLNARIEELEGMLNYEVHVLTDRDYYYSVRDTLQKANSSIIVVMYSMVYDPNDSFDWANDLIRELVNAKSRGIDVSVTIEYRTYFGYMDGNLAAYYYLSSNGVNIKLDNEADTDHLKLVIVDDKIVYVGSHNWSESALYYNHETSIEIISEEIAQIFKQYVETNYG